MAFEIPKQPYSGKIGETTMGTGSGALKIGGEDAYSFHFFEGNMPNPPKIAMEIWDYDPSKEWPAAALAPFKDVITSPEAWAKKCVEAYGADLIVLQLKSTDPNGMDRSAEEATEVAKKVLDAIDVPLVVWGTANNEKDEEVLKRIAEECQGKDLSLGPVEEGNHKGVGAAALGYGHTIVASSPIDVNLAKQLNILLGNLGVKGDKIIIDPTTGGLGYGLEYSYSVMERIRMAALTQEDDKLQVPMISNIGNEVWKSKEAGLSSEEAPTLGDPERRGILMETAAAVSYLMSGADVVILRHPESVRLTRSFIDLMINGGMASDAKEISKNLELKEVDLVSLSPEPKLTIAKEEAPPKERPAQPKEKKVKAAAKPKKKKEKPKAAPEPEKKVVELKPKVEEEAKKKAEEEAKAKTEEEAREKAEEEAKAKAEAEAEARVQAEAKAKAAAQTKEKADLDALKAQMAQERAKQGAEGVPEEAVLKPSEMDLVEKLYLHLKRMHKHS